MLLDLEMSFQELGSLPVAKHIVLPINASIEKFQDKILKLKFPLWIKLNTSEHKLKINAVKKCQDYQELKSEYKNLQKNFPEKKFLIQENIEGIELIAGIKQDKTFDKVLLIGAGGSQVEQNKDIQFLVLPVEKQEILNSLKQLKIYKQLENLATNKLVDLIFQFSQLKISEADLNPIIVNDKEAVIVDARICIQENEE